jgi:GLPGLI family protein
LSYAQEKNIKVTYVKGLKKVTDTTSKKPSILRDISYSLLASHTESVFSVVKKMKLDEQAVNSRFVGSGGGKGVYYKNKQTKEYIHQDDFKNNRYLIDLKEKKWVLTKEKKIINKFICYKAICEEVYFSLFLNKKIINRFIAWYTPEIPMPFGPSEFNGLPGLVLAGQIGGYYFFADKIEFNPKNIVINKPTKGIKISITEMDKKHKDEVKKILKKRKS